jgi:hypothetical protein
VSHFAAKLYVGINGKTLIRVTTDVDAALAAYPPEHPSVMLWIAPWPE